MIRVRFGNARNGENAYSVQRCGECSVVEVAALREAPELGCLFYSAILEHLRAAAPATWMQIQSRNWPWGTKKKDLRVAPSEPIIQGKNYLVFALRGKADLSAALDAFWVRRAVRLYGWQELPLSVKLRSIPVLYPHDRLQDFDRFVPELLRFCAEKHSWGGFLRVLVGKGDLEFLETAVRQATGLLSHPLVVERSTFQSR